MKPTLESLQAACPEADPGLIGEHLSRLGDRYFEHFPEPQIRGHIERLSRLSPLHPVEVMVEPGEADAVECTLLGFDHAGSFSLMVGVLAAMGFSILSGEVFTYARSEPAKRLPRAPGPRRPPSRQAEDPLRRRRIVNHLSGTVHPVASLAAWAEELHHRLETVFLLLETGDDRSRDQARDRVNEMVVRRLSRLERESPPIFYPVRIEVDNQGQEFTRLKIESEDTPAFLYTLTHAFALHDIRIEQVRIRTVGGFIRDEIDVKDRNHRKIEDPEGLARIKLSVLLTKQFTYFLGKAPDPYAALCRFKRFVEDILRLPERDRWMEALSNPHTLKDLAVLLGTSDTLWEDFVRLQYETLLPMLEPVVQGRRFSRSQETLGPRLRDALKGASSIDESRERLNRFKDQEIFSIDLDHILSPGMDFGTLAARLTRLAEQVVNAAAEVAHAHLTLRFGRPQTAAGLEACYAILGLGKLGGAALGYASDIEFLVVYGDNGSTSGPEPIPNSEFFNRLVATLAQLIQAKREGIFQVDLRLRPHGSAGPLACSLEAFCDYYGGDGSAHSFERLALVRLRAFGGDPALGAQVERIRDEIVYAGRSIRIDEIRDLREKQVREKTEPGKRNAKFSPGGLVDLEYNVQILQVLHGTDHPALRTPQLQKALAALGDARVLTPEDTSRLFAAYDFLRLLINAMRMLRGSARDLFLPDDSSPEFSHLARRMGYGSGGSLVPAQQLRLDYETHTAAVRAFTERYFGPEALPGPSFGTVADLILADTVPGELSGRILRAAGFQDPQRAYGNLKALAGDGTRRVAFARLSLLATDILSQTPAPDMALNNWERFLNAVTSPEFHYRLLLDQPMRLEILLKIFAGSQFLADTLIRYPGTLDWLILPEHLQQVRARADLEEDLRKPALDPGEHGRWLNRIRRFRRREILRIGTRDMVLKAPTEETMLELSTLAEVISGAALEGVLMRLNREPGADGTAERLGERFCLLAFGKLGGRELNYSSDIDLLGLFVSDGEPGPEDPNRPDWKRVFSGVMEQLGRDLAGHTEQGTAYRVDLRLRPYGRSGELVPSLDGLVEYYRNHASLWEIQAALKIRPIAGNRELGDEFLRRIRPVLLARRDRRQVVESVERMRQAAIRKTTSPGDTPDVKSGAGGIRDVEFLVQGLQLIHAPDRPELLEGNTLAALRRIGDAGLLPAPTSSRLGEDYLFLRRVEHCLQILEDRQIHTLPQDPAELSSLARRILGAAGTAPAFLEAFQACRERVRRAYVTHLLEPD
jgi:[glutamine synthetase] adenylyltransferase / [glutamine synthetase]-adenylyl-L-tyrosine phosphorylase